MPNEFARSGFHSGETASGYFDESLGIFFNGADRKNKVAFESLEITERQGDSINQCVMDVKENFVSIFMDVAIYNGGYLVGVPLFRGNVIRYERRSVNSAQNPTYSLNASDQGWLIDYHALVNATYTNRCISAIVGDILRDFTEGGFTPGYLPSTLGNLDSITFENVRVTEALSRLAKAAAATLRIGYDRRVSIFYTADDEGNSVDLTTSSLDFWDYTHTVDGSQIGTRVVREGVGTTTTAAAAVGATSISVTDISPFLPAGGKARSKTNYITYTGRSGALIDSVTGPGTVTGVSGITTAILSSDPINVYAQVDGPAQAGVLAGDLTSSGTFTGYAILFVADNVSAAECVARATGDFATFSTELNTATYTTTNPYVRCGRSVTVSVVTSSITLTVQQVQIRGRRIMDGTQLALDRIVTAAPARREFSDALIQAGVF